MGDVTVTSSTSSTQPFLYGWRRGGDSPTPPASSNRMGQTEPRRSHLNKSSVFQPESPVHTYDVVLTNLHFPSAPWTLIPQPFSGPDHRYLPLLWENLKQLESDGNSWPQTSALNTNKQKGWEQQQQQKRRRGQRRRYKEEADRGWMRKREKLSVMNRRPQKKKKTH